LPVLAAYPDPESDPGQAATRAGPQAVAAAQGVCVAASNGCQKAPRRPLALGLSWIRTLWPLGVGVFGWFTGILGAVFGWLARNFLSKSMLEFVKVRQEIQEELTYLSNVDLPSSQTFCEGTAADYEEEVRIFAKARGKVRRLGSKLSALNTSFYRPLSYLLRILGYKIDDAGKNLLRLSTEFEDDDRAVSVRYWP